MSGRVAVFGEALVDLIQRETGSRYLEMVLGGSPYNVAAGLARFGVPVDFVGALAADGLGRELSDFLEGLGVNISHAIRRPGSSTFLSMAVLHDGRPSFSFYGDARDIQIVDPSEIPADVIDGAAVVHGGSTVLNTEASRATTRWALARAPGLTTLDPNSRPVLIDDRDGYRRDLEEIVPVCDVVKMSDQDVAWVYPDLSTADAARRLNELGASLAVITGGDRPTVARTGAGLIEVPAAPAKVIDTTGAGDAYMAALLARLSCGPLGADLDDLASTLELAAAFAAMTCESTGGAESTPTLDQLGERFPHALSVDWLPIV